MSKPIISLILAMSENQVIGHNGALPWHLPDDLQFFQKNTLNKPIIMGRKTYDSIGKPLPRRKNIIISRDKREIENTIWVSNFEEALTHCGLDPEIMVMGGSQIYQVALPLMDRLYLTRVHANIEGDTIMPAIDFTQASLAFEENHPKDERHQYSFTFQIWNFN